MSANQSRVLCLFAGLSVAAIGGLTRVLVAHQDWLWLDELHTAWVTNAPASDVAIRAELGNQSPLFFWLAWPPIQLFGNSALCLRLVPVVAGVAAILLATWLAWNWTRSVVATLVVGWLISSDPWFIFYGTEARPYSLLQLLSIVQVSLFWRLLQSFHIAIETESASNGSLNGQSLPRNETLLVLVSVAMFYCHYTCVWLFAAEIVFFVVYCAVLKLRESRAIEAERASKRFLLIAAAIGVLCLPATFKLIEIYGRRENWAMVSSPQQLIADLQWPMLSQLLLPLICASPFFFRGKPKPDVESLGLRLTERNTVKMPFVLLWAVVPIASVLLLDLYGVAPLALYRYTVVGAVGLPLFAGLCVAVPSKWYWQLAIAILVVGVSGYQNPLAHQMIATQRIPQLRFENWEDPIREINARQDKRRHPVFLYSNLIEDVHAFSDPTRQFQEYLRFPANGRIPIESRHREIIAAPTTTNQHLRPQDIELMRQQGGAWILIRGNQELVFAISNDLRWMLNQPSKTQNSADQLKSGSSIQDLSQPNRRTTIGEPEIQIARFFGSTVYLVSIDW